MMAGHILHLNAERTWRGGERQLAYLIEKSLENGLEISLMCRDKSAIYRWCVDRGVQVVTAPFRNGLDVDTALRIKSYASRRGVSLVHTHSGRAQSLAYMALRLGMSTPVVAHRRVDFPLKSRGPSLAKYKHEGVKAVICVSKAIGEMVREKIGDGKVRVVYSGIDFGRFSDDPPTGFLHRELGWDPALPLVANVSALASHKDYPTFVRAAHRVLSAGVKCGFLIVGEGELRYELEKLSRSQPGGDSIAFLGFREDVPAILRELDVFLITSKTEGLGTTVIDAMYNALPVVATAAGGIPEMVSQGENGFLCPVGDDACLAERILELLADDAKRSAMGAAGKRTAGAFGMDQMAEGVFGVYKEIFGGLG